MFETIVIHAIVCYSAPMHKCIALDTWAGSRYRAVEILGETPKMFSVRLLSDARLPGGRIARKNDVVLAPKHAVSDMQK